jgi:hypothetical protein
MPCRRRPFANGGPRLCPGFATFDALLNRLRITEVEGETLPPKESPRWLHTVDGQWSERNQRDALCLASVMRTPVVMEVHPSVPANTVPEFHRLRPGQSWQDPTGLRQH